MWYVNTFIYSQEKMFVLVLLVGDFPQKPNLSLSHASTHTKQPSISIRTEHGALQPSHLTATTPL